MLKFNITDNTGIKTIICIKILGCSNTNNNISVGNIIIGVVKELVPKRKIQNNALVKSEIIKAIVVRTCKEFKRKNGFIIRYDDNAAVIIDSYGNPKGTKIFGIIPFELRIFSKKIISLSSTIL
uniref:ribosomal protein L14 n=1 Tax=Thonningia sanguinea TaxID=1618145 RepID=UPI0026E1E3F2|nr:ribosomal protein L14 [Thonningia sanguinea]WJE89135.1 ribosomal protein L14 [Thonningia sanguinea]